MPDSAYLAWAECWKRIPYLDPVLLGNYFVHCRENGRPQAFQIGTWLR